jgi:hypothetical protein
VVISTEWTGNVSQRFAKLLHPEAIVLLAETEKDEESKGLDAPPSPE